jgi:glycosyltransferase involved in cell wall biosynthesis
MHITQECLYCIILDNIETQGIASMEIMSCNLPCLIIDLEIPNNIGYVPFPYYSSQVGMITSIENLDKDIPIFLKNIANYSPREYIVENFSLEVCAQKYVDILYTIHDKPL